MLTNYQILTLGKINDHIVDGIILGSDYSDPLIIVVKKMYLNWKNDYIFLINISFIDKNSFKSNKMYTRFNQKRHCSYFISRTLIASQLSLLVQ